MAQLTPEEAKIAEVIHRDMQVDPRYVDRVYAYFTSLRKEVFNAIQDTTVTPPEYKKLIRQLRVTGKVIDVLLKIQPVIECDKEEIFAAANITAQQMEAAKLKS